MKRLIICADGTWNTPDEKADDGTPTPTNVKKISDAVLSQDAGGIEQKVHYEPGVGTDNNLFDKWFGGGIGKGIDRHIKNCYTFLVDEYELGDEVYFFGFSRGAFTVRSLAGLIRNSGLLRKENADQVDAAFDLYRDRDVSMHPSEATAIAFRAKYSYTEYEGGVDSTPITSIGVWDTVGSLGIPLGVFKDFNASKYHFYDTSLSSRVKTAFHAMAIDERRGPFAPTLWRQSKADADAGTNWLEQAWFTGAHSNVGGGCKDPGLSDTALAWMKDRVAEHTGLRFDDTYIAKYVKADPCAPVENSMTGIYETLPPYDRVIDDIATREREEPGTNTWEYVHASVEERFTKFASSPSPWDPMPFKTYKQRQDARFWPYREVPQRGAADAQG